MEDRYKRKSILESSIPDPIKTKEKLIQNNINRIKLRRQKIFTENRMKMIKKSVKPSNTFNMPFANSRRGDTPETAQKVIDTLSELKFVSDELERHIEYRMDQSS